MFETRDLCWLTKKVQNPGISTWYMDEESDSPISKTIAREMPLLFAGKYGGQTGKRQYTDSCPAYKTKTDLLRSSSLLWRLQRRVCEA